MDPKKMSEEIKAMKEGIKSVVRDLPPEVQDKVLFSQSIYMKSALIDPIPATFGMALALMALMEAMEETSTVKPF